MPTEQPKEAYRNRYMSRARYADTSTRQLAADIHERLAGTAGVWEFIEYEDRVRNFLYELRRDLTSLADDPNLRGPDQAFANRVIGRLDAFRAEGGLSE